MSSTRLNSAGLWLMPSLLATKTIAVGTCAARAEHAHHQHERGAAQQRDQRRQRREVHVGTLQVGRGEADSGDEPALLTREMILRLPEVWPTINIPTPYSGTPLYDRLHQQGRIVQPGRWDLCTLFDVNYLPAHMTVQELRQGKI